MKELEITNARYEAIALGSQRSKTNDLLIMWLYRDFNVIDRNTRISVIN